MKKVLVFLVMVSLVLALSGWAVAGNEDTASVQAGSVRIGYVDLNLALNTVEEGKKAKADLEADGKAKKQKLEILQAELKRMKEDLDKQRLILSAEAMREKEMQFQQKFLELQKMSVDFEKEFAEKEVNYIKPISEKLKRVITQIGQSESYTIIVPKEMALYSLPGADLTDKIIAAYNKTK